MELWILITIVAAFSQNIRSALQKNLKNTLSTWGVTGARFVYAAPLALLLAAFVLSREGDIGLSINGSFVGYGVVAGLGQILATGLLIHLFSARNFTVATALTKTEPIQTALFGIVLLGEHISPLIAATILISIVGVMLVSIPKGQSVKSGLFNQSALTGIVSGGLFGLSSVAYRGASLSLEAGGVFLRASLTLAFVSLFQSLMIFIWLRLREPGQTALLLRHWRAAGLVGLAGMVGSLCWTLAVTLETAAHVRAVGQVEVIFLLATSMLIFKEGLTAREISGALLVALGVVGLVLATGNA